MTEEKIPTNVLLSILSVGLLGFTNIMLETALNVDFPILMDEFHIQSNQVQWLTSGVILLTSIVVVLFSWLKKNFYNRTFFMVAGIFSLVGIVIDAFSTSFSPVLIGRLMQGVGAGVGLPLVYNVVFEQVPKHKRGFMIGVASLIISFAPAFGPGLGGVMTGLWGWHSIFLTMIPVQLFSLIVGFFTLKQVSKIEKIPLDWIGWGLLSGIMFFGILALTFAGQNGFFDGYFLLSVSAIILMIVGYQVHLKLAKHPIISIAALENVSFTRSLIAQFILQTANLILNFAIPMVFQFSLHLTETNAGILMMIPAIINAITAVFSGRLFDRFGGKSILPISLIFFTVSLISALFFSPSQIYLTIFFSIFSIGTGWWFGNNMTLAVSQLDEEHQADGNMMFSLIGNYSAAFGIALGAGVMSYFQSLGGALSQTTKNGFDFMLIVVAVFIIFVGILNYLSMKTAKNIS